MGSLRRVSPNWIARIRGGWKAGGFFVGAMTVIGTLATLAGVRLAARTTVVVGGTCLLFALVIAYARGRLKLIPDAIIDELGTDEQYSCRLCSSDNLREACGWTRSYYGDAYVGFDRAEQWRLKNPNGFMEIVNANNELCAVFGLLALAPSFMDEFVAGRVTDAQINETVVLSFDEARRADRLYISGVIVREPGTHRGYKRACVMIWAMLEYLKRVSGLRTPHTIYALAVTRESETMLQKLDFKMVCEKGHRQDHHNLYRRDFDKAYYESRVRRVGDYARICDIAAIAGMAKRRARRSP